MPFPYLPSAADDEREFLIQDPFGLRNSIVPVLTVNRHSGYLTGLGTAFKCDPFGSFLTAQHIFDHIDLTKSPDTNVDEIPIAMMNIGLVFGTVGMSRELYATVSSYFGFADPSDAESPMHFGPPLAKKMLVDCLRLTLDDRGSGKADSLHPLPIQCGVRWPEVGDRVMAVGFPELGLVKNERPNRPQVFVERMHGAIGEVTAIHKTGLAASRPWPAIEVRANWRSGMSGGPIFNEDGAIIGIVSSSVDPDESGYGVGFGVCFREEFLKVLLPRNDLPNPMHFKGFAVLRSSPWHFAGFYRCEASAAEMAAELGDAYEVVFGSNRHGSDDFVVDPQWTFP